MVVTIILARGNGPPYGADMLATVHRAIATAFLARRPTRAIAIGVDANVSLDEIEQVYRACELARTIVRPALARAAKGREQQ